MWLALTFMLALLTSLQSAAQVNYKGGSNVQLLYGRHLQHSGQLATITLEHFGDYGAWEHFGFTDLFNNATLAGPDLYLEWYPKLSLSRITGSDLSFGPLSDVLLGGGVNVLFGGTEDFFASVVGPSFKFRIPGSGLLQLETYYYKQNGAAYKGTYQITPSWDIPLPLTEKVRLRFRGFMDFIGDRGPGSSQYLTQPQLFVDMGSLWAKPGKVYLGSEWRYWKNVVGIEGLDESILQANILFSL
ncbi:outer membrane protein OmpK [Pontibacter beigongshangensis]|uniref:outer membrane protein OmpK n=1 Tax=Pontibacter beigongshangensis TaxID=2574733 RepID=UPI00164EED8E|nr:outer membrane protein OmpK [Pontibacter beigongshangensis]